MLEVVVIVVEQIQLVSNQIHLRCVVKTFVLDFNSKLNVNEFHSWLGDIIKTIR